MNDETTVRIAAVIPASHQLLIFQPGSTWSSSNSAQPKSRKVISGNRTGLTRTAYRTSAGITAVPIAAATTITMKASS